MEPASPASHPAARSNPLVDNLICGADAAPFDLPFDPFADTYQIYPDVVEVDPPDWLVEAFRLQAEHEAKWQAILDDFDAACDAVDAEERRFRNNANLVEEWKAHFKKSPYYLG